MSTMSYGSDVVKTLLENNGTYPGDPQMLEIVAIRNTMFHKDNIHVSANQQDRFNRDMSPAFDAIHQKVLWNRASGLTEFGKKYLAGEPLDLLS